VHIIVLAKQVPDIEKVQFQKENGWVDRKSADAEINPFDLNALEAAQKLKEKLGATVTVISMGPPSAEAVLKEGIARDADRGILLTDDAFKGSDTLATSYALAAAIKKVGDFDLILCGEKTVDGDTGQVGPETAEWLGIPHVNYVREIVSMDGRLKALCDMSDGLYLAEVALPALITVTRKAYRPRYATPQRIFAAVGTAIERWGAAELAEVATSEYFGLRGSPTRLTKVVVPPVEGRKGERLSGSTDEVVAALIERLGTGGIL
jgi:electron transfer flavoprotein beta subunit